MTTPPDPLRRSASDPTVPRLSPSDPTVPRRSAADPMVPRRSPSDPTVPGRSPSDPTVPRRRSASEPEAATPYRFGPGVPTPMDTGSDRAVDVWRGTARPDQQPGNAARRRRRRLLGGWLLPVAVLTAVLAYLAWQWHAAALAVTGASVRTDPGGPPCDGTAVVTGTLVTNGQAGTVDYRWRRSDGTVSNTLHQAVDQGVRQAEVVLRWTFDGRGTLRATATLEVLAPDPTSASVTFRYACR